MIRNSQKILNTYFRRLILFIFFLISNSFANNVIVVVIDGARYSETFGAKDTYLPFMWNELRPKGTIFTNFYNEGSTKTNPGHATLVTGNWQKIANNGTERPTLPTIFEYYRQQTGSPDSSTYIVAGAGKLSAISYSTYSGYGSDFGSRSVTNNYTGDLITYNNLITIMEEKHPNLIFVNFKQVDKIGHSGNWQGYLDAITQVDSLIHQLWLKIHNDPFYKDSTTLFITNDHGRHDDEHGGFVSHGDGCEGCSHIMCLAIGQGVGQNQIVTEKRTQIDLAPTISDILSISSTYAAGSSFNNLISSRLRYTLLDAQGDIGHNKLTWEIDTEIPITDFEIKRSDNEDGGYQVIASFEYDKNLRYYNDYTGISCYSFIDDNVYNGEQYWYKIIAIDSGSIQAESEILNASPLEECDVFSILNKQMSHRNYYLEQNYPNPFNPSTTIEFSVPDEGLVTLDIYNMLGQKIETLLNQNINSGVHQLQWNASHLSNGTYLYRLQIGNNQITKKMVLRK